MSTLTIHRVAKTHNEDGDVLCWFDLETDFEVKSCCYRLDGDGWWDYEGGDSEPLCGPLRDAFHSEEGNKALTRCYESGESETIETEK